MTTRARSPRGAEGKRSSVAGRQINCAIGAGAAAALDRCKVALEAGQAETVRTALLVLDRLVEADRAGARVLVSYPGGRSIEIILPVLVAESGARGRS